MIKISVIVPIYNMERYLGECLDSILCQSLSELEVIAINDGSTDDSLSILQNYESMDSRIRIINKKNAGVGAARNDGIRAAKGEFVAFMDPDDKYAGSEALQKCYEAAKKENVLIAGGRLLYLHEDGTIENEKNKDTAADLFNYKGLIEYKNYQYDYGYTKFIYQRKMLIDNNVFFPLYSRFQDPPFFVKAMITSGKFYLIDEPIYMYRQIFGKTKYSIEKTLDFLKAIIDNLRISKENNLVKLHYITANRLDHEGSFMVINNLYGDKQSELMFNLIKTTSMVDAEWLRDNGYSNMYPFVPEAFKYMLSTTGKYEKLRSNAFIMMANRIVKALRKSFNGQAD